MITVAIAQPKADSVQLHSEPIFVQTWLLAAPQLIGFQANAGLLLSGEERHILKKSGREKVITKERIGSAGLGFYYESHLHTNVFLTADYAFVRRHQSGFYRKFAPLLGVSRTFLTATTYIVDDNGMVSQHKTAGDWRLVTGFTWGIGKRFDTHKPSVLRDVYLSLNTQLFYPEFRSIVLKPSLQIGASVNLSRFRHSVTKTIKIIKR